MVLGSIPPLNGKRQEGKNHTRGRGRGPDPVKITFQLVWFGGRGELQRIGKLKE